MALTLGVGAASATPSTPSLTTPAPSVSDTTTPSAPSTAPSSSSPAPSTSETTTPPATRAPSSGAPSSQAPSGQLPPPPANARNIKVTTTADGRVLRTFTTPRSLAARSQQNPYYCATGRFQICEILPDELNAQIVVNNVLQSHYAYGFKIDGFLSSTNNTNRRVAFNIFWQGRTIKAGPTDSITVNPTFKGHDGLSNVAMQPFTMANNGSSSQKALAANLAFSVVNTQVNSFSATFVRAGSPVLTTDSDYTLVRCENATEVNSSMGCANVSWTPTFSFSSATYPEVTANIIDGQTQLSGVGAPGGQPLIRVNSTTATQNRNLACAQWRIDQEIGTPPANMVSPSCDEYPFASTEQGGINSIIRWVPLAENTSHGTELQSNYRNNRIMNGDFFFVTVN